MNISKNKQVLSNLAASSLFLVGLILLLGGTSQNTSAAPGDLFVSVGGSGTDCTQVNPCDLGTAVSQSADGDTIYVAQGTYTATGDAVLAVIRSATLLGGWDGSTTTPPVRDPEIYPTTLDGQNTRRVVYINGDIAPTLDGFIITRGNASTAAVGPHKGGGIYSGFADPIITHNQIVGNNAYNSDSEWGSGGGIYIYQSNGMPDSAVIRDNLIANNNASSAYRGTGGGLEVYFSRDIVISDNTFKDNIAGSLFNGLGGGISLTASSAVVTGNWIQNNQASSADSGFGGGFYSENGDITLSENWIINNRAEKGTVTFYNSPNITITNNIIAQNTGGGLFIRGNATSPITGILAHNTIAQNGDMGVCAGCGVPGYATLTLTNNIITGHPTGISAYPDSTSLVTATHTLFYDNDTNTDGASVTSTNEITGSDPRFLNAPGDNFKLHPFSPAIDAGTAVPWLTTDIDGNARPLPTGGDYDIGADEALWLSVYLPVVMKISE